MAQFFVKRMEIAFDNDLKALQEGKPALEKMTMLKEIEIQCKKRQHQHRLLDYNLLRIISDWLKPLRNIQDN